MCASRQLFSVRVIQNDRHFPDNISNAFSSMQTYEFRLKYQWILFLRVQLTINQHKIRSWLGAGQTKRHFLNQSWLVYQRIFASLNVNDLMQQMLSITDIKWSFVNEHELNATIYNLNLQPLVITWIKHGLNVVIKFLIYIPKLTSSAKCVWIHHLFNQIILID